MLYPYCSENLHRSQNQPSTKQWYSDLTGVFDIIKSKIKHFSINLCKKNIY